MDLKTGWDIFIGSGKGDGRGECITPDYRLDFAGYGYGSFNASGNLLNYGQGEGWCFGAGNLDCTGNDFDGH